MKRVIAVFLVLTMCIGILPMSVLADDELVEVPAEAVQELESEQAFDVEKAYAYYLTLDAEAAEQYLASLTEDESFVLLDYIDAMKEIALSEPEGAAEQVNVGSEAVAGAVQAEAEPQDELTITVIESTDQPEQSDAEDKENMETNETNEKENKAEDFSNADDEPVCDGIDAAPDCERVVSSMTPVMSGGYTVIYHPNTGTAGQEPVTLYDQEEILYNEEEDPSAPLHFTNNGLTVLCWNTSPDGRGTAYGGTDLVESDLELYAIWYPVAVYDWGGNFVGNYSSLSDAYSATEPRQQIVLLYNVTDNSTTIGKELLFDRQVFDWTKNGRNFSADCEDTSAGFYDTSFRLISYYDSGESTHSKYQFRGLYTLHYEMGGSTSATYTKPTKGNPEGTTTYLLEDETLYRAYKTRLEKSAYFAGWYLDPDLHTTTDPVTGKTRVELNGEVTETKADTDIKTTLKAVEAPYWPTETEINEEDGTYTISNVINLYPKWYWTIYVGFNSFGTVTCNDKEITNGTAIYCLEGSFPTLKFIPKDGYYVYRVSVKQGSGASSPVSRMEKLYIYTPSWYENFGDGKGLIDRGLQVGHTVAVVFAKAKAVFGEPDFTLPSSLTAIEEAAFEGIQANIVYVPDTCAGIGAYAFRNTAVKQIRIPEECAIADTAFDGCGAIQIFGKAGSTAETFCSTHDNCTFVEE